MEFIADNWAMIVAALALIAAIILNIAYFAGLPTEEQVNKVKEWLLYAVTMAEKELGGGTGKIKLRYVYDLFLSKFSWLAKVITFERFSTLVDEALDEMKELLKTNKDVQAIVESDKEQGA